MSTETTQQGAKPFIKSYIPILEWLPAYKKEWLRPDVIAALSVWALLVPEAMAYATLAGVPPEAGLFAAPLALLGYAIFGTSRQLVVGPSSTVAVMSAAVVGGLALSGTDEYIALTVALAIIVGLLFIIAGLLKLGFLADFMSRPVLSGLVVGIAITIVAGQIDDLLGYSVPEGGFFQELFFFTRDIKMVHWPTVLVSTVSLALLFGLEKFVPKIPAALVVVVLGIVVSGVLGLESYGVHIVGEIPAGLPSIGLPGIGFSDVFALLPGAMGILLVAFAESIAAARSYASKHHYEVDADQEMIGLGVANFGAGMSQGFVVDGSLSRTAAADQAGQKSQLASIINAGLVLITAAFLTPLFRTLPEAVLGAIVVHAVWHLISFKELRRIYHIRRVDFWAGLVALLGVLVLGILAGLALAVMLSFLGLLARASRPAWAILGLVHREDRDVFGNVDLFEDAETYPGLIIFRFDQQLFFANAPQFRDAVRASVAVADPPAKVVLIDTEVIADIDTTGTDMLEQLRDELARAGTELWFARVRAGVMEYMRLAGLEDSVGPENFYLSVRAGVDSYLEQQETTAEQSQDLYNS
jgi:high affinity sulfate transporter 1